MASESRRRESFGADFALPRARPERRAGAAAGRHFPNRRSAASEPSQVLRALFGTDAAGECPPVFPTHRGRGTRCSRTFSGKGALVAGRGPAHVVVPSWPTEDGGEPERRNRPGTGAGPPVSAADFWGMDVRGGCSVGTRRGKAIHGGTARSHATITCRMEATPTPPRHQP